MRIRRILGVSMLPRPQTLLVPHHQLVSGEHSGTVPVMASQVDAPPAPQPVQQAAAPPPPVLQQGYIQGYEGHLHRRTKILKRWKKEWLKIVPGKLTSGADEGGVRTPTPLLIGS